jgi:hypothetical protein
VYKCLFITGMLIESMTNAGLAADLDGDPAVTIVSDNAAQPSSKSPFVAYVASSTRVGDDQLPAGMGSCTQDVSQERSGAHIGFCLATW